MIHERHITKNEYVHMRSLQNGMVKTYVQDGSFLIETKIIIYSYMFSSYVLIIQFATFLGKNNNLVTVVYHSVCCSRQLDLNKRCSLCIMSILAFES